MRRLMQSVSSALAIFAIFLLPASASAQGVQDFVITSFTSNYELSNEDPQGLLKTTEHIELNYSGNNRGILRAIPEQYGDIGTNPRVISVERDGKTEPYITYSENDNMVIRIGEENTYITGEHKYKIVYEVENVITFYDDHDELYWDVNGDQWQQTFEKVEAELRTSSVLNGPRVACYTGGTGSAAQDCTTADDNGYVKVQTSRALNAGETLTFVTSFEKGYFTPPPLQERLRWILLAIPVILLQLYAVYAARKKWLLHGKDYKKRGIIVPYFERPKNISVMQAAYVSKNKLTPGDLTGSIIDLAIRGYIKITEEKLSFGRTKHLLTMVKQPDSTLAADEKMLIDGLFGDENAVRLEDKKHKLYTTFSSINEYLDKESTADGYYELSPKSIGSHVWKNIVLVVLASIAGAVMAGSTKGVSGFLAIPSVIAVIVYSVLMTKRSQSGNMLVEHMEGLKLYLNQAEKDRIKNQDAVAAPLAKNGGQPTYTVEFFEKLLPFAVVMGVEKSWAKAFSDIYTQPPDWYSGNWSAFSTAALVNSIGSTASATATSFSSPSSSGGSGFSGGSAGGGGGGGGGGGW